VCESELRNS